MNLLTLQYERFSSRKNEYKEIDVRSVLADTGKRFWGSKSFCLDPDPDQISKSFISGSDFEKVVNQVSI
jgi:hypothetical protein